MLRFRDLSVEYGFEDPESTDYIYDVRMNGSGKEEAKSTDGAPVIRLPSFEHGSDGNDAQLEIRIAATRNDVRSEDIRVYIGVDGSSGYYTLAGIERK